MTEPALRKASLFSEPVGLPDPFAESTRASDVLNRARELSGYPQRESLGASGSELTCELRKGLAKDIERQIDIQRVTGGLVSGALAGGLSEGETLRQ